MNVSELIEAYKDKEFIPYFEFLNTDEWKQKRDEILKRDGNKCTNCGRSFRIPPHPRRLCTLLYSKLIFKKVTCENFKRTPGYF